MLHLSLHMLYVSCKNAIRFMKSHPRGIPTSNLYCAKNRFTACIPPHAHIFNAVDSPTDSFDKKLQEAIANPKNMGEMPDADSIGTVGSADCGDMLRMFLKFTEKDGKKIIDRASFQSFGCQTAIAIASVATEMLKGKSIADAQSLSAEEMTTDLGPLPPVKIHCGQMVEGALRSALTEEETPQLDSADQNTLAGSIGNPKSPAGKIKITITEPEDTP